MYMTSSWSQWICLCCWCIASTKLCNC